MAKMAHRFAFALLLLTCLFFCGCNSKEPAVQDAVLTPGQSVEATNKNGKIRISYVSATKRKYEWDDRTRIIKMTPREEPFDVCRELGIYNPGDAWFLLSSSIRLVVGESILRFDSEEQVNKFLYQGSAVMDWVYTNDGLVVGFGKVPARQQINVDLYQILIQGKKPSRLKGARPELIKLTPLRPQTSPG